jgi:hypothetical protein
VTPKSSTPASLTWSGVTSRRMARHALTEPAPDLGPAEVAGVLCGAHAQVLSAAEFSIGRRIAGATRADVQRALWEDRTLVKTFGPRGTVHLLPTADLPMWTGALSALPSSVPAHPEPVRFSAEQAEEVIAAIGDALADTELTVDELTEAIVDRTGPWAGEETMEAFQDRWPRWRQLTSTAAHRGVLCFGPNRGRNVTYTNPHRWLPGFRPDDGEAALRGLVTRYLYAYGPATPQHFARWLAIPPRRAVALFDELAGEPRHPTPGAAPGAAAGEAAIIDLRRAWRSWPAEGLVERQGFGHALEVDHPTGRELQVMVVGPSGGLLAHHDLSGLCVGGDPGGQVHGPSVHVPVLGDDRAGMDTHVGRGQVGCGGALGHVESGQHGRVGLAEVEHPAIPQPPDGPAPAAAGDVVHQRGQPPGDVHGHLVPLFLGQLGEAGQVDKADRRRHRHPLLQP